MVVSTGHEGEVLAGPENMAAVFHAALARADRWDRVKEHVWVAVLDAANRLLEVELVHLGAVTESLCDPKLVLRPAVVLAAPSIALAHSHPSGNPSPNDEDREVTRRVWAAAAVLGVRLLDSLIVTRNPHIWYSFAESGLITELQKELRMHGGRLRSILVGITG